MKKCRSITERLKGNENSFFHLHSFDEYVIMYSERRCFDADKQN